MIIKLIISMHVEHGLCACVYESVDSVAATDVIKFSDVFLSLSYRSTGFGLLGGNNVLLCYLFFLLAAYEGDVELLEDLNERTSCWTFTLIK